MDTAQFAPMSEVEEPEPNLSPKAVPTTSDGDSQQGSLGKTDSEIWDKEDDAPLVGGGVSLPSQSPSPAPSPPPLTFKEAKGSVDDLKNARTHELVIKVAPNGSNASTLDIAEQALAAPVFAARRVNREATRTVLELGLRPVTIEIGISRDLDRCVVIKVYEPVPDGLFVALRDSFAKQMQSSPRANSDLSSPVEEHEESTNGQAVKTLLDPEYVEMLKREMKLRAEKDLTAFATPLERRAKDDERRVKKLEGLLVPKYTACRLPLPAMESAPPLSAFPLSLSEDPSKLILKRDPSPREVDAQLKMALRRNLHNDSLARQERKKKEVLARAEVCERNRFQLVSMLANSNAALAIDRELMERIGVEPPQVALCRVGCLHARKPGFLVVTNQLVIFEPVGMWGFRLGSILKLEAKKCRSVMKGQGSIGIADSLCIRTDTQEEHVIYFPTMEEVNEAMDMVFELIWQVLRMNRWTARNGTEGTAVLPPDGVISV